MAVWQKEADNAKGIILFVHDRTWSSIPDFDLQVEGEDLSLMDGMLNQGYTCYAIDLRGYGETPRDSTEWNTPNKAARDIITPGSISQKAIDTYVKMAFESDPIRR